MLGLGTDQPMTPLHLHADGGALPAPALITSGDFISSKNDAAAGFSGIVAGASAGNHISSRERARGTVDAPEAVAEDEKASDSNPANALLRSTSSLTYKRDVEPVDPAYS